ncbi:MAG: hypothetical protein HYX24_04120 [Candidatus Aenigmarchaeota archaeon]|nr:hypothetical protein [Candidatus Aenigmarchaeota archaeon]
MKTALLASLFIVGALFFVGWTHGFWPWTLNCQGTMNVGLHCTHIGGTDDLPMDGNGHWSWISFRSNTAVSIPNILPPHIWP